MAACGICGSAWNLKELRRGGKVSYCLLCDWTACPKCGTPTPPLSVDCPQCGQTASAHNPETLTGGA